MAAANKKAETSAANQSSAFVFIELVWRNVHPEAFYPRQHSPTKKGKKGLRILASYPRKI